MVFVLQSASWERFGATLGSQTPSAITSPLIKTFYWLKSMFEWFSLVNTLAQKEAVLLRGLCLQRGLSIKAVSLSSLPSLQAAQLAAESPVCISLNNFGDFLILKSYILLEFTQLQGLPDTYELYTSWVLVLFLPIIEWASLLEGKFSFRGNCYTTSSCPNSGCWLMPPRLGSLFNLFPDSGRLEG